MKYMGVGSRHRTPGGFCPATWLGEELPSEKKMWLFEISIVYYMWILSAQMVSSILVRLGIQVKM